MVVKHYEIGIIGCLIILVGYILAYITSFSNSTSTISFKDPSFSISQAMHFGNKGVIITSFLIGTSLISGAYILKGYNRKNYGLEVVNTFIVLGVISVLISLTFMKNIYTCGCTEGAILPSCCYKELNDVGEEEGEQIEIGKCTYDKIKKEYNTSILGDPTCCNPPSCVTDSEYGMNKNHLRRAYLIAALQVLFVILNGFYWKKGLTPHVRDKGILILALVSMLCGLFTYWDRPGDKYKLLFGICENITIPIFLLMIIFSLK